MKKYFFEGIVIFSSVLFSLYIGNLNDISSEKAKKNGYILDLSKTIKDDILQIESLLETLYASEEMISSIQTDIDERHSILKDEESIKTLIGIEVGFSFFPKDGIFNQMIATGSFELISNNDLKNNLLEIYNHQKARNYATSLEIDNFNIGFRQKPYTKFRIRFDYNLLNGEFYGSRQLTKFKFNKDYYFSNEFYGMLSQAKLYSNMYKRQLSDILKTYKQTQLLINQELQG